MVTKEIIQQYLDELTASEYYCNKLQMSVFPDRDKKYRYDLSVTQCTTSAILIAERFQGKVYGYSIEQEVKYQNLIGFDSLGHDFAVVGNYVIDWWAANVAGEKNAILNIYNVNDVYVIVEKYMPIIYWEEVNYKSNWLK